MIDPTPSQRSRPAALSTAKPGPTKPALVDAKAMRCRISCGASGLAGLIALAGMAGLAGCQAGVARPPADNAPSAALEDLGPTQLPTQEDNPGRRSLADAARQSVQDLEVLMSERTRPEPAGAEPGAPPPTGQQRPWQREPASSETETSPSTGPVDRESGDSQAHPKADGQAEPQAGTQAGAQTGTETEPSGAPSADAIRLVLDRLERESLDSERALSATLLAIAVRAYGDIDDGATPGQQLSPPERELATGLEPLLAALAAGERSDAPHRVGLAIDQAAGQLANVLPVRINDAALATDIYGFASYRPFERNAFMAGRSNRMLLYTEPAWFQSQPTANPASRGEAANPGAFEVRLGLELRLFNERGSMLAWRRPEEQVAIRSDRPRSEIYLGTMIELPASLSVGQYQLKVILRDLADGSEDERVIPIQIVADPRLTVESTRDR